MSRRYKAAVLGLVAGALGFAIGISPFGLDAEEAFGLDWLFRLRGATQAPSDVVIVAMNVKSAEELHLTPDFKRWPRSLHALLIERLAKSGASAIIFDVFFTEEQSPEDDEAIAAAFRSASNVILMESLKSEILTLGAGFQEEKAFLSIERVVQPEPRFAESAMALAPFPLPKVPVKVTKYWAFNAGASEGPTLPVVAFQFAALDVYDDFCRLFNRFIPAGPSPIPEDGNAAIAAGKIQNLTADLRRGFEKDPDLGEKMLRELAGPTGADLGASKVRRLKSLIELYSGPDTRYLNFYGPPGTIANVPFHIALQDVNEAEAGHGSVNFRGKAVFIGSLDLTRPDYKDGFHTAFSRPTGIDISGVEIAATAFANLSENKPVRPVSLETFIAVVMIWGLALGFLIMLLPTILSAAIIISAGAGYLLVAKAQFSTAGTWYPIVIPLLIQAPSCFFAGILWNYLLVRRERRNIRKVFGFYLPERVVDRVVRDVMENKRSDQELFGAVLHSDGAQYATLSESMPPRELSEFMNSYYETIFPPVNLHDGTVGDVVGDSMMALWASPQPDPDIRMKSCLAALGIASALDRFNPRPEAPRLHTRIGLHYGRLLVGNIGGAGHYEYRAVGDVVNTASRIEGLNKYTGTRILVSEDVMGRLDMFLTREVGSFVFAGKTRPTLVHELICLREEADDVKRILARSILDALRAYRERRWEEAAGLFREAARIPGNDILSRFYIGLCESYRKAPPDDAWTGQVYMDKK